MSVQLLDKTRKINKLLHNNNSSKVVFNDICEVLSEILEIERAGDQQKRQSTWNQPHTRGRGDQRTDR